MIEIEVVKFCKKTHKPLDKKIISSSVWLEISKKIYKEFYYKAYQIGFSQFFNKC